MKPRTRKSALLQSQNGDRKHETEPTWETKKRIVTAITIKNNDISVEYEEDLCTYPNRLFSLQNTYADRSLCAAAIRYEKAQYKRRVR